MSGADRGDGASVSGVGRDGGGSLSGVGRGDGGSVSRGRQDGGGPRAWAELLRLPALFTVPGDVLAGAAAVSARPGPRTLLAVGSSLCLYEAGMALNDWADRDEDAAERPHRPLPSGRIHPTAALTAACALTAAGLALAARAGRPALAVATPLAATVWAYDLGLKRTPAGPVAMAAARGLDLLLGAAATRPAPGVPREALPSAALLATHTLALTAVSRHETTGGAVLPPLAALATTATLSHLLTRPPKARPTRAATTPPGPTDRAPRPPGDTGRPARPATGPRTVPGRPGGTGGAAPGFPARRRLSSVGESVRAALVVGYAGTAGRSYLHAVLNPSAPLTQRAVGGGIRATIPLQAALSARAGALGTALFTAALGPLAAKFGKKVSVT
ncbi:SCO3242 family prenyltransferase [Streptomyces sp. NPDC026672]|uniref:SCO3242 family prenyltransferase n=1 Tax=unclassified Streptomyces TaxID=2593676 RepID=UPI0034048B34